MLWLTFTARNICKDVSKDPLRTQDKTGAGHTRPKPTVLRFYLVSDGIPLLIVGITAAFGLENYGSRDDALYCWMAWEPSLGGFYAPVSLLVLVMSVYFLWTFVQLKRHPERKYELRLLTEEQQQLSSAESCNPDGGTAPGPAGDCPPFAAGVSVLANEHSFKSQLRATAFTLFLVLSTWALGALAVSMGHFLDMVFSCLYGAFCVTLGLFLLIQHCAKRDDVWHRWWACCPSKTKTEDGGGDGRRPDVHQPHCHMSSPGSGKQPLLSPPLMHASFHKMTPPPQSPTPNHTGPCCVAVMSPVNSAPVSSLAEPASSPRPQSLPDELPRPPLPLQSCLSDRAKSRSFSRPRPCLQDYRAHMASASMDGSVHGSHLDSPLAAHRPDASPLPDLQLPCPSPHLDKQLASCQALQRQTSCQSVQDSIASCHALNMHDSITSCHSLLLPPQGAAACQWHLYGSADPPPGAAEPFAAPYQQIPDSYGCPPRAADRDRDLLSVEAEQRGFPRNTLPRQHATMSRRAAIGRNRSLQEDGLFGSDATGNIRTGPWKNETTV
ncbi:adhesion G protein-coupled receptor A1-like [Salarias fasciatus]|uniref:adhesion G protein-coupled receptor A1-like n=1 Tax=Salarias fasciatus TaxID=181472 RepID=UPI0011765D6B|nr:adhesion G protein-coupled receptor A1-like [Salarias fasciatus]